MMVKVRAPAGPVRGEVLQLAQTVRSRVVEVAEESVTLVVTGDAGKMAAVLKTLARFGIVELARTGRVALKRGEQLFDSTAAWEGRRAAAAAALCGAVGWVLAGWGAVTGGVSMDWWAVCSCGRLWGCALRLGLPECWWLQSCGCGCARVVDICGWLAS